jgi:hypothetical protein
MAKPISAELIRLQAAEMQRVTLEEGRDEELAAEVTGLNDVLHEAAWDVEDDDEPAHFLRALLAGMRPAEGTR